MNFEFCCLIIIFTLLVLLVTFGDMLSSSKFTEFIGTLNKSISAKSIISSIEI